MAGRLHGSICRDRDIAGMAAGDAETWPVGIGDEAFIEAHRYNWDPWRAAAEDVVACEEPP